MEVEVTGVHGEVTVGGAGPLIFGFVAVELDSVLVGIGEVDRFAYAVVGCSLKRDVGGEDATEGPGERGAVGVEDGSVIEAGGAGRRR